MEIWLVRKSLVQLGWEISQEAGYDPLGFFYFQLYGGMRLPILVMAYLLSSETF
jgi:hypothetical protein